MIDDEQRRTFLQAIIEDPDDDTHRLMYADWLKEHGEAERAEFIRVQCELAKNNLDPKRRRELKQRADALLTEHEQQWAPVIPRSALREGKPWSRWHRGFLYTFVCYSWNPEEVCKVFREHPVRYWNLHFDSLSQEMVDVLVGWACLDEFQRLRGVQILTRDRIPSAAVKLLSAAFGERLTLLLQDGGDYLLDLL